MVSPRIALAASGLLFLTLVFSTYGIARGLPASASPVRVSAVLTTDCGADMDDQWALTHLLLSPEQIDLRAVVTTHGSSVHLSSVSTAQCTRDVVAHVLGPNSHVTPPIDAGSSQPLSDPQEPRPNIGVDRLLRIAKDYSRSHRLTVFVIGAATDVASALLVDPTVADRIRIVAMAFNDWPDGGDVFNVKNDPVAWSVILRSRAPVVIGSSWATAGPLRLTRAGAAALMRPHGTIGTYLDDVFNEWVTAHADLVANAIAPDTWAVWDEVVVAYTLGFARAADVPRPELAADLTFKHPATHVTIAWVQTIDGDALWRDLTAKIDRAEERSGK